MNRIGVLKTFKVYIGGALVRTESGRYYPLNDKNNKTIANVCLCSRKDVRNAVVAARSAQEPWASRTAYNKGQIIYRMAEMLESRKTAFIEELMLQGINKKNAIEEVEQSIDKLIYFAGWSDKYQAVYSSVNPVASNYFNFSVYEPMGVVAITASNKSGLLSLINTIIPAIIGGNTVIVLAAEKLPLSAISLSEVLATSDLPKGVINILTGRAEELMPHLASHMDINAFVYYGNDIKQIRQIQELSIENLKRIIIRDEMNQNNNHHPKSIIDTMELKTTWHPIEVIGASGSAY